MSVEKDIDEIRRKLEKGEFRSETDVSDGIVRRLLEAVGWPRWESQVVIVKYPMGGGKVEFVLCPPESQPLVFIEAKKVGNIQSVYEQQFEYNLRGSMPIAVLTDGQKWIFFHPIGEGDSNERKVYEMDLVEASSEECAKYLHRYLNYESMQAGETVQAIKEDYKRAAQRRQMATRLPEAWKMLIEEADDFLLEVVADKTESFCGHRPEDEQVLDFLKNLKEDPPSRKVSPPTSGSKKAWTKRLLVTMPSGEIISNTFSSKTFAEVIEKLGVERVKSLELWQSGIPLISTEKHSVYNQQKSGVYYIMTNTSTEEKKKLLDEIALKLKISEKLKVEIIMKS